MNVARESSRPATQCAAEPSSTPLTADSRLVVVSVPTWPSDRERAGDVDFGEPASRVGQSGTWGWGRYWETIRHLRLGQILHQVRHRLVPAAVRSVTRERAAVVGLELEAGAGRDLSYLGGGRFEFLNRGLDLGWPIDWDAAGQAYLWRYHLHYFDWLGQAGLGADAGWTTIRSWMDRHEPLETSVGWEPYPTSLRVVNWLKFLHAEGEFPADVLASLMVQGSNLARRVEHHLAGNHVFANGKALWWLGACLGQERWRALGRRLVLGQLAEQFGPDGGHFELAPMYHAILLEDLLDLINLTRAAGDDAARSRLEEVAARALGWLEGMKDGSGRLPLFNDSAEGMARGPGELERCAARLGVEAVARPRATCSLNGWEGSDWSGYWVWRGVAGRMRLWFDTALLGPDHLPGHAHGDMLSILLEADGRPILTDTGVFEYGEGAARSYARSTAAHNTVSLDGLEQADMWKSFRMGRRGHPGPAEISEWSVQCGHDGFARQRRGLRHLRRLEFCAGGFVLVDELAGRGTHRFESRFHFAPGLKVEWERPGCWRVGDRLRWQVCGAEARLETSPYYPAFGQALERPCLVLSDAFHRRARVEVLCTFCS